MFSNNEYQELEADHRRTLEQLDELRKELARVNDELDAARAVLRACADLSDEQVRWFQNSGPFRHICKAEMKRRGLS